MRPALDEGEQALNDTPYIDQQDYWHVYPVDDISEHELEGTNCICGPRLDGRVVIHNSLDGREAHE